MTSRRGLFGRLIGAALAPVVAKFIPAKKPLSEYMEAYAYRENGHTFYRISNRSIVRIINPDSSARAVMINA